VLQPKCAFAQSTDAGVSGRVTDQSNLAMPAVEVEIKNVDTGLAYTTKTNNDGFYSFPTLPPGNYVMNVHRLQFRSVSVTGITLHVQDSLSRNFVLQVGSSDVSVTVTADQNNINTTDASVSTVIDRQFVENIPLNGRSLQSLITLTPGVLTIPGGSVGGQGEFSVNGQRTEGNYFTVDGVSGNTGTGSSSLFVNSAGISGSTPAETQLGTTQSLISLDALQEFRATTSTYSAEYGRTPGGQFSFVSRSGTNTWHGSAFDYFRNEALDANNWFSDAARIRKTPERQNDFGGTLGGPLFIPGLYNGNNRTFFFFSYEGLRLLLPEGTVTDQYPDANLRRNAVAAMQPFLNAWPVPNGPEVLDSSGNPTGLALYTAAYSNPSNLDSVSIRVDHNLTNYTKVFGRYSSTSSESDSRAAGADLADIGELLGNIKGITAGATTAFSTRLVNELRFNYTHNDSGNHYLLDNFGGAQPFRLGQVPGFGGSQFDPLGGNLQVILAFAGSPSLTILRSRGSQRQWNVTDAFSLTQGSHALKFGFDYRRLSTHVSVNQVVEDGLFFGEPEVLAGSADVAIADSVWPKPPEPVYTNLSAYAQDEWRLSSRLTFSLGLRWDVNPPPGNANGNPPYTLNQITDLNTAQLAPAGTPLWHTDYLGFAPRLGVAYLLRGSTGRETVLRGGFGIFYDMGNNVATSGFHGVGFESFVPYPNIPFPLTPAQLVVPPPSIASPYNNDVFAFDPNLWLPYAMQWNVSVEQALAASQALKVMYVGSVGRKLLFTDFLLPPTNPNFSLGNPLHLTAGRASSSYHSLQIELQKRLSHGLQALASYTWSHSIDDGSTNFGTDQLLRGSSDFDVRHNFQMALTYDIPGAYSNPFLAGAFKHWGVDTRVSARSALPVDITTCCSVLPNGQQINLRPNLVSGVPVYLYGGQYPGGRILNFNAFVPAPNGVQGDLPRNFARGLGSSQLDLAIRREFPLVDRFRLQFRAEAFNILNHPNFGSVDLRLSDGPFTITTINAKTTYSGFGGARQTLNNSLGGSGLSPLYQTGGPRSFQLALKLVF
jgi:outer membrane receptor protein involved in Fe transport